MLIETLELLKKKTVETHPTFHLQKRKKKNFFEMAVALQFAFECPK